MNLSRNNLWYVLFASFVLVSVCNKESSQSGPAEPLTRQPEITDNTATSAQTASLNLVNQDAASDGGTITFQNIGTAGWYPSRRDPATGPCDAYTNGTCCMAKHYITSDSLTPWNEELIMTLRGPIIVKQIAVYQPDMADKNIWDCVSLWDDKSPATMQGIAFKGNNTETAGFAGTVGNTCLVDVSTNRKFPAGPGSIPYCPAGATQYYGWDGSKMIILLATMPHVSGTVIDKARHCSVDTANGWYDAPWIGLSHGELVRAGAFGNCQCYCKDPAQWWLADGCGQFNVFEVVNDNNSYQNFDLFSTNFFGYGGYVGEGPCGKNCNITNLNAKADLINKANSLEATGGALSSPTKGPGAAFRRPAAGYRFFVILMDVQTRTVQLAIIHPSNVPPSAQTALPGLPQQLPRTVINNILALRLPAPVSTAVIPR
jgi:hypothetical protein